MILFPLFVLFLMGRSMVNDVFPMFATSTEERIVESVSDCYDTSNIVTQFKLYLALLAIISLRSQTRITEITKLR